MCCSVLQISLANTLKSDIDNIRCEKKSLHLIESLKFPKSLTFEI